MKKKFSAATLASLTSVLSLVATAVQPAAAAAAATTTPTITVRLSDNDTKMVALVDSVMANLRRDAPAGAPPGTWKDSGTCWRCDAGPALGLAAAAAVTRDPVRQAEAEKILDYEISMHQNPNGSFGSLPGPDIDTMSFANEVGMAAILLRNTLDKDRAQRWSSAVSRAADFLIKNGNLAWYTNGNINIGNTLTMALAARLTGDSRYTAAYETAWAFAVAPPTPKWAAFGFRYLNKPTHPEGWDGRGYFTEAAGSGTPGFDAEYTQVQADGLAAIFLITGDPRVKMHLHMVSTLLWDRVNKTTWLLDTSGGTRHPQIGRTYPYDTAALSVVAHLGGRPNYRPYVNSQVVVFSKGFQSGLGDRLKGAFGWTTAMVIMSQPDNSALR